MEGGMAEGGGMVTKPRDALGEAVRLVSADLAAEKSESGRAVFT